MIWLILAVLVILAAILVLGTNLWDWETSGAGAVLLCVAVVVFLFYLCTISESVSTNAELRAFAASNRAVYAQVVELTKKMESPYQRDAKVVDGAAWEQNKVASDRLREFRDKLIWYNSLLREKREYAKHWYLRMWITDPPAELDYLKLDSVQVPVIQ